MTHPAARLLLVDDDPAVLRAYATALVRSGWTVETASNGKQAVERTRSAEFDVILSDLAMPEMGGLDFLRAVREHDLDVPVILMTGAPGLESAMRAVEFGAFRYLVKPVDLALLEETVGHAVRLHELARVKGKALELLGSGRGLLGDRASLEAGFAKAMDLLWMAYQPIISWRDQRVYGYEALLRSADTSIRNPGEFLDAAERLEKVHELGRAIRAQVASAVADLPAGAFLFINLHSADLNDDELYAEGVGLAPSAVRCVLEITERASLDGVKHPAACVKRLRDLGFRIAVDDLGTGYAGLTSFTQLDPEIAKLDMSLVRGIDADPRRQAIVRSMTHLCAELGVIVVAEGVETPAERDALVELGCDLLQGYLFARPEKGYQLPRY